MEQLPKPAGVELVTAGIDVQQDYLATLVCGWSAQRELWCLDYFNTQGNVRDAITLPALIGDLQRAGVHLIGIDSGYATDAVHAAVRGRRGVVATRGEAGGPGDGVVLPLIHAQRGAYRGPRALRINTYEAKSELMAMLRCQEPGRDYVHIPKRLGAGFVDQLTSEELVPRFDPSGVEVGAAWKRKSTTQRNEALDCAGINLALFHSMGPTAWAALRQGPNNTAPRTTPAPPRSNRRW